MAKKSMDEVLLENDVSRYLIENHYDEYNAAVKVVEQFPEILYTFVSENIHKFLDDTLDDTLQNIYVFAEAATHQLMTDLSASLGECLPVES